MCFVGVSPSQSLGGTVLIKHGFQQLSLSSLLYLFPKKDVCCLDALLSENKMGLNHPIQKIMVHVKSDSFIHSIHSYICIHPSVNLIELW